MALVAAIDQGTTSSRCVIVNEAGEIVASAQYEHRQIMPQQGWVEHDPQEIWRNTRRAISAAMVELDISAQDIVALGITNQRETAVVWDKATGEPIYNAIVWQDVRTQEAFAGQDPQQFMDTTGLMANSYPAGPKIAWILDNVPGARARAEAGELVAGTIDTWLLWNLTTGTVHATDVTNASRTLLMDLRTLQWDDALCEKLGVPRCMLPEIRPSVGDFGAVTHRGVLEGVPITGVLGDQQSALFGQAAFEPGEAKNTYGTGLFLLMNTGDSPKFSTHGMLTTVAYQVAGQAPVYAMEGSVAVGGSLIQWLRDQMGIVPSAEASESVAAPDNGGVYIVPAFSGLFAPRWRPDARGVIVGLTRFADRTHIVRAALEATCFQTREVVEAMVADSGLLLQELYVDGGMVANDLLMQLQSDVLQSAVVRPREIETTALGAAFAAGLGVQVWPDLESLRHLVTADKRWEAQRDFDSEFARWGEAVERTLDWV